MEKILVLIDVQNDFITGSLANKEAQKALPNIVEKVKNWNESIYATLDTHYKDYLNTLEGQRLPVKHCIEDTEGRLFPKELEDILFSKDCTIISKTTFGSISSVNNPYNDLPNTIEDNLTDDFEITLFGFCTDICVISNALILRAYFPNTIIKVDSSCCAGTTPENHKAALKVMKSCQIDII